MISISNDFSVRTSPAGYCPIGLICYSDKYSINEDFGGFSNLLVIF